MIGIAGVVVLYNPCDETLNNIITYLHQVEQLYIVDNSDAKNNWLVENVSSYNHINYINNEGNKGVGYALNKGVKAAIQDGHKWLLTMDQDTKLPFNTVELLHEFATSSGKTKVGIVSPKHFQKKGRVLEENSAEVLFTMTSANLLNLDAIAEVGGFMNELFIDHVDHEFCFRLGRAGYKIFELNTIKIEHQLGEKITVNIFWRKIDIKGHSPLRLYYITRNGLIVSKMYPEHKSFSRHVTRTIFFEIVKSLLFYKEKIESLRKINRACFDYRRWIKDPRVLSSS